MNLYLIAHIAGHCVAFETGSIESVVDINRIVPTPGVDPTIRGLAALRSRVITVIDAAALLALDSDVAPISRAVLANVAGHLYAFIVAALDEVIEAAPRPLTPGLPMTGPWARAAIGLLDHHDQAVLILDPAAMIPGAGSEAARAA